MLGIGWIGTSFFFVWLDMSLRASPSAPKGVGGESWMVHGGGFYHAQKYLVAPESLPKELHWFKYEAYFTWVTGFVLLSLVYYFEARTFLIDPRVLKLAPRAGHRLERAALSPPAGSSTTASANHRSAAHRLAGARRVRAGDRRSPFSSRTSSAAAPPSFTSAPCSARSCRPTSSS